MNTSPDIPMKYPSNVIEFLNGTGIIKFDEPMKNYCTFKCGGPADILVYPDSSDSLSRIMIMAGDENVPVTVIGGGSNLLVGDRGIRGIVIRISDDKVMNSSIHPADDFIYSDASISKKDFMSFCIEAGYEGVEFMAGIPGSVGGGIIMNAGTGRGAFVDILDSIDIVDRCGAVRNIRIRHDMTSYRELRVDDGAAVTGGFFRLKKLRNKAATIKLVNDILEERKKKHPITYPSAGSVFKNPEGHSSWKLINDSGLKGTIVGGAMVSELHTNFIINQGNAKSADIFNLIEKVRGEVFRRFNILLETEIRMLGEF